MQLHRHWYTQPFSGDGVCGIHNNVCLSVCLLQLSHLHGDDRPSTDYGEGDTVDCASLELVCTVIYTIQSLEQLLQSKIGGGLGVI